jgi:hypothetical protein
VKIDRVNSPSACRLGKKLQCFANDTVSEMVITNTGGRWFHFSMTGLPPAFRLINFVGFQHSMMQAAFDKHNVQKVLDNME